VSQRCGSSQERQVTQKSVQKSVQKKYDVSGHENESKVIRGFASTLAAHAFNADDLEANRNGALSDAQIEALRKDRIRVTLFAYFLSGVIALLLGGFIMLGIGKLKDGPIAIVFLLMIGVICFTFATGAVRSFWRTMNAIINDGHVESVTGPIDLAIDEANYGRSGTVQYKVTVAGYTFKVSKDTLLQLKNGEVYTVYFTPQLRTFLSAEPTDAATQYVKKAKHGGRIALGDDGELISET
jgi:hypothetical protein